MSVAMAGHVGPWSEDNHREAIQEGVTKALRELDGSVAGSVSLLTGMSRVELEEIGGVPEPGVEPAV